MGELSTPGASWADARARALARLGDAALDRAVGEAVAALRAFRPDGGIFVACGFDGLDCDPSSKLRFTPAGYGAAVRKLVEAFPHTPMLATWEGGYTTERQADAFASVVRALARERH